MSNICIGREKFGQFEGSDVELISIDFDEGLKVEVISFGGIIKSLHVPTKEGTRKNVVLTQPDLSAYVSDPFYIGCLVGRYANRIKDGQFEIDGVEYQVARNLGSHHLHGGSRGFGKVVWDVESVVEHANAVEVRLRYLSKDGEEGYPGNLDVLVTYRFMKDEVKIIYRAETDQKTLFNPTQHTYFNLHGDFQQRIDDQLLQIDASKILAVDDELIPTGQMNPVQNTVFDFSGERAIGSHSFDTCYRLDGKAELTSLQTGIKMTTQSTLPGIQVYSADYLGEGLVPRSALCLETQYFPDSPNQKHFPSTLLTPSELHRSETVYRFMW